MLGHKLTLYIVLTTLCFSAFIPALVYAAPLGITAKDWEHTNGGSWAGNYSPQTTITKDNVNNLEVKWIFPVSQRALGPKGIQGTGLIEGANTPPIVRNGKVYAQTNWLRLYSLDAASGKLLWMYDYSANVTALTTRDPVVIGGSTHSHGFRYWEAGNMILQGGPLCDFYGVDADTGKQKFYVADLCNNIPGSIYKYVSIIPGGGHEIATYEKGKQFIIYFPGGRGGAILAGRAFVAGINMDNYQTAWRVYLNPPYDKAEPDWALQYCDVGYFPYGVSCSDVVKMFGQDALKYDWQKEPGKPMNGFNGVSSGWGQPVVDEDTGTVYIPSTGNQSPYTNVTFRPGPNLYGSTILAIDLNKGSIKWWLQPLSHDPWDYDCNWGGILADVPGTGKVFAKGCKEGILYVMNAATGKPVYWVDIMKDNPQPMGKRTIEVPDPSTTTPKVLYKDSTGKEYSYTFAEWIKLPWPGYPDNPQIPMNPIILNGAFQIDMSYDPATQTLFHYYASGGQSILKQNPIIEGKGIWSSKTDNPHNTTIVARDITTGKIKWEIPPLPYNVRGHLLITGGMVVSPLTDGYIRFYDESTGKTLREMNLGSTLVTGVTTGQDSKGDQKIFGIIGQTTQIGIVEPGTVFALGLSSNNAGGGATPQTTTVTTTATTTTTTVSTSATTVTTTAPAKTVTTTSATTVTATQSAQTQTKTTTITSSAPAQTTTVTSSITQNTGLPSEVTYGAVGVAVIALIAAAALAMRKK
ncbi:MAG: hypothetical protein M1503_08295 [Thaumarchaeota archaeon]|nr:hypothetical protein [Nitrososphaerota archaeon]MCL5318241.1 hypothetical protein [Nitrososphaerota archaeon]